MIKTGCSFIPQLLMSLLILSGVSLADSLGDCDILMGRLYCSGQESYQVSEQVFEWIRTIVYDQSGLKVELYGHVVKEENLEDFNALVLERNISALLIGSYYVEAGSVFLELDPMQAFSNPSNLIDREHFSTPGAPMRFDLGLLTASSVPPECVSFHGFLLTALVHFDQNRYSEAFAAVSRAIDLSSALPMQSRSFAFMLRSQINSMSGVGSDSLHADLDRALELDPEAIRARLAKGYLFEFADNIESAMEQYDLAVATDSTLYKSFRVRGNLYSRLSMYDESIADYTVAVRLNPMDFESWRYGCDDLFNAGDYQKSVEWSTAALAIFPDSLSMLNDRSAALVLIGEYDRALEDINRSLELDPANWVSYYSAATIHLIKKEWSACSQRAAQGLDYNPNSPRLLLVRATALMMVESIDTALEDVSTAIQLIESSEALVPDNVYRIFEALQEMNSMEQGSAPYLYTFGYVCLESSMYGEAIDKLSMAIQLDPSMVEAYYLRGLCFIETGYTEQASVDMSSVLDLTSDTSLRESALYILNQLEEE